VKNEMKMNVKMEFWFLCAVFCSLFSGLCLAGEYQGTEYYGNGQTSCFRGAILGSNTLTPAEEVLLTQDLPIKENGHYYARVCANTGTLTLTNYQRRGRTNFFGTVGVVNRSLTNQIGLEVALGYFFDKRSRLEVEYLVNRNSDFTATVAPFAVPSLNVSVSNNTFLFNGYYEFTVYGYDRFRPFVVFGLGPSFTTVRFSAIAPFSIPGATDNRTRVSTNLAVGGGIGFRFRIFSRWSVTLSFRYISLGTVTAQPNPNFRVQGNYYYSPVSLGLIYVF
jgi:opacity protein-like surface antigen